FLVRRKGITNSIEVALIALACMFAGTMFGMFLRSRLPEQHMHEDARDVMKLGIGMIATLAALVLGLLISSAKHTFDTLSSDVRESGLNVVLLDRTMARYGPETKEARDTLRSAVKTVIDEIWGSNKNPAALKNVNGEHSIEELHQRISQLSPQTENQRRLHVQALEIIGKIGDQRFLSAQYIGQSSFPMPLLVLLICWLVIIFFGFGLLSSRNSTVVLVLFVCALSAASALLVLLELDQPFGG